MWCCAGWLVDWCLLAQSKHVGSQLETCSGVSVCVRAWRQSRGEESLTYRCNQQAVCLVITRACARCLRSPALHTCRRLAAAQLQAVAAHHIRRPRLPPAGMYASQAGGWLPRCTGCCHACRTAVQLFTALFFLAGMPVPRPFPRHIRGDVSCQRGELATHTRHDKSKHSTPCHATTQSPPEPACAYTPYTVDMHEACHDLQFCSGGSRRRRWCGRVQVLLVDFKVWCPVFKVQGRHTEIPFPSLCPTLSCASVVLGAGRVLGVAGRGPAVAGFATHRQSQHQPAHAAAGMLVWWRLRHRALRGYVRV